VLYDVTSTYLEGRCCPLAQFGYSLDYRSDRPQLVIGLLCALDGRPVAAMSRLRRSFFTSNARTRVLRR
jgi:transposase